MAVSASLDVIMAECCEGNDTLFAVNAKRTIRDGRGIVVFGVLIGQKACAVVKRLLISYMMSKLGRERREVPT